MALDVVVMVAAVLMVGTTARQVGRPPPHVRDTPRARRRTAGDVGREFMAVAVAVKGCDAAASLCFGRDRAVWDGLGSVVVVVEAAISRSTRELGCEHFLIGLIAGNDWVINVDPAVCRYNHQPTAAIPLSLSLSHLHLLSQDNEAVRYFSLLELQLSTECW